MTANLATAKPMGFTWNDSQSPALSDRVGGTAPNFTAMNGTVYGIQFGAGEEVHGSIQLPHSYAGETDLQPHFHFVFGAAPTAGETVIWAIDYAIAPVNGVFTGAVTLASSTYTITANDAANPLTHRVIGTPTAISGVGQRESSILMFRAYRSGGDSSVEPFLLSIDLHFQQGNFGTAEEYPV